MPLRMGLPLRRRVLGGQLLINYVEKPDYLGSGEGRFTKAQAQGKGVPIPGEPGNQKWGVAWRHQDLGGSDVW